MTAQLEGLPVSAPAPRPTYDAAARAADPAFALHRGGKVEVVSTVPLETREDLSLAYTPGVARICTAIAEEPDARLRLHLEVAHGRRRHRRHRGARPRRHRAGGRAAGHGGQGAAVQALRRHRRRADLPRRHRPRRAGRDHRAARAGLRRHQPRGHQRAALLRGRAPACRTGSTSPSSTTTSTARRSSCSPRCATPPSSPAARSADLRVVVSGAGAAGIAVSKMILEAGIGDLAIADSQGMVHAGRERPQRREAPVRRDQQHGRPHRHASSRRSRAPTSWSGCPPGPSPAEAVALDGAATRIVFAMANPDPEVHPDVAHAAGARVVATGRSDFPNQINNVLAFPGVFQGAMAVRATRITEGMKLAAVRGAGRRRRRRRPDARTA